MDQFLDWPGKSPTQAGGSEHPAVYHMLDVAAVAEQLMARVGMAPALRDACVLLVALHDLGKVSEDFRKMLRGGPIAHFAHWKVTEAMLVAHDDLLALHLGGSLDLRRQFYAATAGHHGRPPDLAATDRHRAMARAGQGAAAAREVIAAFCALWPEASLGDVTEGDAVRMSWWLPGLCSAADWIGSNVGWFGADGAAQGLDGYLSAARVKAARAVASAGLGGAAPANGALFDFALRPMQRACRDVDLPDGPMLAVIEDETGAGKTEAAFVLAQRMLLAGKGRGLFVALPTMATADAMFLRAADVVGRLFATPPTVTLAHGRAGLSDAFRDIVGVAADGDDGATCSEWLAESRRRALLADVGVGTIDQALLAVLPVKFQTLRHFALSSKILIVDEVHELGEPYIGAELEALLQMHRAAGGSAILLTATLPLALRRRLLATYGGQADSPAYPALTVAAGAAITDLPQATGQRGPVAVNPVATVEAAIGVLVAAAGRGAACVWVRNAVDDAIAAVEALRARGIEADLLHARFALSDRKRHEAAAMARFGKKGAGRGGRVLVGTQVLESSLDLDFDVMVSDLAPMAALIQRAGRLWRHMDLRPAADRPVGQAVLNVVSPDPGQIADDAWLHGVLDRGAYVYPLADVWRTAAHLFAIGKIDAPAGLRGLIEAVHGEGLPEVPAPIVQAALKAEGENRARRAHARHNIVEFGNGYRMAGCGTDDAEYPTRLGEPTRVLVLARLQGGGLVPWSGVAGAEGWSLSEVTVRCSRLAGLPLPDQSSAVIMAATKDWPDWKRATVHLCPVAEDGTICAGLRYEADIGLRWAETI